MLFVVVCWESPNSQGIYSGSNMILVSEFAIAGYVEKWLNILHDEIKPSQIQTFL